MEALNGVRTRYWSLSCLEGWNVCGWDSILNDRFEANKEAIRKRAKILLLSAFLELFKKTNSHAIAENMAYRALYLSIRKAVILIGKPAVARIL